MKQVNAKPIVSCVGAGLIASICCGGSLIFASIGLGAFYSSLGLSHYVPQVLAAGALSIIAINYFFYCRPAQRACDTGDARLLGDLHRSMFISAALGLAAMAGSFVFLEWFNHAVVNPHRFLVHSEYGQALIPGVPNIRFIYALASFFALAFLWGLPFPHFASESTGGAAALRGGLRALVFLATAVVLVALVVNAIRFRDADSHESDRHGGEHVPQHGPSRHGNP